MVKMNQKPAPLTEAQVRREIADRLIKIEAQLLKSTEANDKAMYLLNELHLFFEEWEAAQEKRDAAGSDMTDADRS